MIYLDNSTTCQPSEKAVSQMLSFYTTFWGTPTAPHQKGQELFPFITDFYEKVYHTLGANENDQFVLTSSGSESINQVFSSVYRDVTLTSGKNQYLTVATDEAPSIMAGAQLEKFGCLHKSIPVNEFGCVTKEGLSESISPRTALISLSWANGLTGVIQPLDFIIELCQQRGIKLHLDITHAIGKLLFELKDIQADYITFNGDQIHATRGTGGLFIKHGVKGFPLIAGGSDQGGLRAGALNVASLAGLATALVESKECLDLVGTEVSRLRNKLENGIVQECPTAQVCYKNASRLPHCTTILFPGIANESLLFLLNRKKVFGSIGGGNFQQIGLLLAASGIDEELANSAVNFSLSRYTTEEEIEKAIELVAESALKLSSMSKALFERNV